ncbi:hypothetical protein [Halopenitus persicus]|uniref:DUF1109 domain-containing protein n=1 Tax=Halopenitus persicus TaxID=1048396 RepID=A0A1H3DVF1_9EURY|nr:hypothetical protein [Halopenitus persicus]QHS16391.1 hypothetical protein GWK26_04040 [haloarchaeon 3A1-DGR]SDX70396.1 hypothetical protein SAMN05216564_101165 [Halopenitus persicus]
MNLQIDGGKVLYALGVLFALGAFVYFIRDVVFGLSITVKAALLFLTFLAFLLVGLWIDRDALDVVAYAIASLAYAVFLGYVISRYDPSETGIFLLFVVSAALFVGLGYVVRQGGVAIPDRTVRYALVGIVGVGVLLVGADVASAEVDYTAELDEEATLTVPDRVAADAEASDIVPLRGQIGTLTVRNGGPFTRPVDLPSMRGCVVGTNATPSDRGTSIRYEQRSYERSDRIGGGAERTHAVTAELPVRANATDDGSLTFAVERGTDCDVSREEPTIVVIVGAEGTTTRPPLVAD